jgi:hypothetical protein
MSPKRKPPARGAKPAARAKKAAPKKAAAKSNPKLAIVPRKASKSAKQAAGKPAKPASRSFPQIDGASLKQMIVFQLLKSRAQVLAALQGLVAGTAEQPLGEGKWNTREIVLHLCCRDRARLREFEAALRGVKVSWQGLDDRAMARVNAAEVQPILHLAWDESLRLLHSTRQSLMEAIEGVPEEPAEVWSPEHPFGWMLHALPPHDQHHAEIVKQWRAESGA